MSSHDSAVVSPRQRFPALMELYVPENESLRRDELACQGGWETIEAEQDRLYQQLVQDGDIDTFQSVADIDSHVAASIGVWGVMEIANANYKFKASSKDLREQSLAVLRGFANHSSSHVRGAAMYAFAMMGQHEFKDLVISHLGDTGTTKLFFPPFIESNNGLSTGVDTQARQALINILGEAEANPIIQSEFQNRFSKNTIEPAKAIGNL
jgi:hypothetical protein